MDMSKHIFTEDEIAGLVSEVTALLADFGTRAVYRAYTRKSPTVKDLRIYARENNLPKLTAALKGKPSTTKLNALPSDVQSKIVSIVEGK